MLKKKFLLIIILAGVLSFPSNSFGFMSSTQYTIFADSVNSGGIMSVGGDYVLEDTLGESPTASSTGNAYTIIAGYQAMSSYYLAMSLSTTTINLGTLDVASVASSSLIATIGTDVDSGYQLSMNIVSMPIAPVSDGVVTAGQEEFGMAVEGVDTLFVDDRMNFSLSLSASSTPVTAVETEITFKAAINNSTTAGERSFPIYFYISATI